MKKLLPSLLLLLPLSLAAKTKEPPKAPLPSQVTQAKTVFLVDGGGSPVSFDEFYSQMKSWGKYQIVGSEDQADLVMELRFELDHNGHGSSPGYNPYTKQTTYYDYEDIDPKTILTVYDAKSRQVLWTTLDHAHLVRLSHNVPKERMKSVDRVVEQLKSRQQ